MLFLNDLLSKSVTVHAAQENYLLAKKIPEKFLNDVDVAIIITQIREATGSHDGLAEIWADLFEQSPQNPNTIKYHVKHLLRSRQQEKALKIVDIAYPIKEAGFDQLFSRAELLDDVQAYDAGDELFRKLIADYETDRNLRITYAKRLAARGLLLNAYLCLEPVCQKFKLGSKALALFEGLKQKVELLLQHHEPADLTDHDCRIVAMHIVIESFEDRSVDRKNDGDCGKIALITGSLGPGGAERQMSRLAALLAAQNRETSNDAKVEVIVKSCAPVRNCDFFLPYLQENGVDVAQISSMKPIWAKRQPNIPEHLHTLLEMMPPQVHYGVTRLVPHLKAKNFDVISLWQDGAVLFGAVAALLSGARNIQLVFRGLPPNIRGDRQRPEYLPLYRALAKVPGVHFLTNSQITASEYAAWLQLPVKRFDVLYNGVPPLDTAVDAEDKAKWQKFKVETEGATETIGGVFRYEPDKQPLIWVKLAKQYLKQYPKARFVSVGNGRLFEKAQKLAQDLGIDNRILFVGHSQYVGFWYDKMDVKVLLSRYEGLPNVLIEAQHLGVPVVSTPAGGAVECFIEDQTGKILSSALHPDLVDACKKIKALVELYQNDNTLSQKAMAHVRESFSEEGALATFCEISSR